MVKYLPTMRETRVQSLGRKDLLEKEMASHSSILAWKIPWTEEPGRLHSPWGRKESDTTERLHSLTIKLPMAFFTKLTQKISQFIWKHKRSRIAKAVLRKNGAGGINLLVFRLYYKESYSHQDSMILAQKQKYRLMEQDRKPRRQLLQ